MQKLTLLVLVSLAFVLTACFRSAGSDTPTAQPVGLSGDAPTEVADSPTDVPTDAPTDAPTIEPTQETLPTNTPTQEVAVLASPTETDIPPSSTPSATVPVVAQGGDDTSGEGTPLGELSTPTTIPTVQVVIQPTDTPTATASNTATNTVTPTATASPTASATATATQTNTPAGPTPTKTTVPLQSGIQNTSNGNNPPIPPIGQGGQLGPTATTIGLQPEVAQVVTATPTIDPFGVPTVEQQAPASVNQLTATAVIQNATQTQAAVETIAAGGDPNAVQQPQQVTPGAGGQTIIITATPLGQAAPDCEYLVQIGDNLGTIANRYNTTINDLAVRNSITNPDLIRAGYPIIIPGCGQNPAPTTTTTVGATPTLPVVGAGGQVVAATNNANGPFTYTVQAGDNIYRLSVTYGVTMREILASNPQITNMNVITEGQQITIPGPPTQTTTTTTTVLTPTPNIIIVTPTPLVQGAGGVAAPTVAQPQVVQPTQPIIPAFTPTFTLAPGAQG